jgi:hypothetical protein
VGRVRSEAIQCEICGGEIDIETCMFSDYCGFPLSVSFHQFSIAVSICMLFLPEEKMDEAWRRSHSTLSEIENVWEEKYIQDKRNN